MEYQKLGISEFPFFSLFFTDWDLKTKKRQRRERQSRPEGEGGEDGQRDREAETIERERERDLATLVKIGFLFFYYSKIFNLK